MAPRKRQTNLQKVRYVFDAALERRKAFLAGDYTRLQEDAFCDINDPILGVLSIGREALAMLDELAETAMMSGNLSGRVGITTARELLGPILVRLVIHEREPITEELIQRAFSETAEAARKVLVTRTYLLPCHIVDNVDPASIVLGPVSFLNRSAARALLHTTLRDQITANPSWTPADRRMIAQAIAYYRKYRWVALVTVDDCDPKIAGDHAHATITLALSGLQLFLGAQASRSMSVKGDAGGWARTAQLKITPKGAVDVSVTVSAQGGAFFEAGWSSWLKESGMQIGMGLLGVALEASLPGVDRPLSSRFLGSLQWYGEAVREQSPATRFIKFVFAIEHLLLTGERDGITGLLARRAAALTYEIGSLESRLAAERKFKRIYAVRSKFVHGGAPPWDASARHELKNAADMAEEVLHGALNCWREEGLTSSKATAPQMRRWFEEVVRTMAIDTEPLDHERRWLMQRASNA